MTERLAEALAPALAARERAVLVRPGKTPAAVLVPLLPVDGEPHLLGSTPPTFACSVRSTTSRPWRPSS
ncbi:MAG: hypothetical protein E6J69_00885 [Deltaproteobacteria bacterium]|nr:MAG: hypothetical protein E6J69_00885 [Deltaproteobacteria bacterium]